MVQSDANKPSVCFICSPGLGILDNWMPVLCELRKQTPDAEFICIMPKASIAELIDLENILIKISEDVFDKIIFRSFSGMWLQVNTFADARKINTLTPSYKSLFMLAQRFSRFSLLSVFPKSIFKLFKYLDFKKYSPINVKIKDICRSIGVVLYDVYEESKDYNCELLKALKGVPKYSICHGININQDPIVRLVAKKRAKGEVKAYLFSEYEKDYYKGAFSLSADDLKVVGIPRHDKNWVDRVTNTPTAVEVKNYFWKDYILIISRSLSPYFPRDRKKKALKDIKRLAFEELNLKIVVKLHPKERDDGLFEAVLGTETYGVRWVYSNAHPYLLGRKCTFAVTFYSGVATDMIALGVPVIEYLDLRGLQDYDNSESLRDVHGEPVLSLRHLGIVLGASNYEDLKMHAANIINKREQVMDCLGKRYEELFPSMGNSIALIANDILLTFGAGS